MVTQGRKNRSRATTFRMLARLRCDRADPATLRPPHGCGDASSASIRTGVNLREVGADTGSAPLSASVAVAPAIAVPIAVAAVVIAVAIAIAVAATVAPGFAARLGDLAAALAQLALIFAPAVGASQFALALALFLTDLAIVLTAAPALGIGRAGREGDGANGRRKDEETHDHSPCLVHNGRPK